MKLSVCGRNILTFFILITLSIGACAAKNRNQSDWDVLARKDMVYSQIRARGVRDERVMEAMLNVERHRFVPKNMEKLAYGDYPLPIGEEQTISQPYIVALMTEQLSLKPSDRVLEIGTGSGYQAAVLSFC